MARVIDEVKGFYGVEITQNWCLPDFAAECHDLARKKFVIESEVSPCSWEDDGDPSTVCSALARRALTKDGVRVGRGERQRPLRLNSCAWVSLTTAKTAPWFRDTSARAAARKS